MSREILGVAIGLSLLAGCSWEQQVSPSASGVVPAHRDFAAAHKCERSGAVTVTPCFLTFRHRHNHGINVEAPSTYLVREHDNCAGIAKIFDFSGPAWLVASEKTTGNCKVRFTSGTSWAELKIDDDR